MIKKDDVLIQRRRVHSTRLEYRGIVHIEKSMSVNAYVDLSAPAIAETVRNVDPANYDSTIPYALREQVLKELYGKLPRITAELFHMAFTQRDPAYSNSRLNEIRNELIAMEVLR